MPLSLSSFISLCEEERNEGLLRHVITQRDPGLGRLSPQTKKQPPLPPKNLLIGGDLKGDLLPTAGPLSLPDTSGGLMSSITSLFISLGTLTLTYCGSAPALWE